MRKSLFLVALATLFAIAGPAVAQHKVGGTFVDEHGRVCTITAVRTLTAKEAAALPAPSPRFALRESATLFGRSFGYTLQSQRPVLRLQAGGSCPGGVCPIR